jgi:hypothetical protein
LENNANIQFNAKAIYNFIYKEKKQDFTPQQIKKIVAKIRTELHRLTQRNKINQKNRGFYQAKPLPHIIQKLENPDVKLHGIKIECQIIENNTKGILPITSEPNIFEGWLEARGFEPISNNRYSIVKWWENRKITFTFHVSGLIEIFISASNNPLGLHDWIRLLNWFNGFFDPILFDSKDMFVRQIGFARDFRMLRLEGVSSISLQVMTNIWTQAYQKDELVRFEHHMSFPKLYLNVDDVTRSLLLITTPFSDKTGNGDDSLLEVT